MQGNHTRRWMGIALAGVVLALAASNAFAQVFYPYPGARPVTDESPSLGLVAGFGDNLIRLGGFGRFNLTPVADLGIEAVYDNVDSEGTGDDTGFGGAGIDGKYGIVTADESVPVDIALQLGAGFRARSDFLHIRVPLGGMVSHDFVWSEGRRIVPFGGVYMLMDYVSIETAGGDESDTDFDVELRLGAGAEIIARGSVFAALHTGNGTAFFIGFNAGL